MSTLYIINLENPAYKNNPLLRFVVSAIEDRAFKNTIILSGESSFVGDTIIEIDFLKNNIFSRITYWVLRMAFLSFFLFFFNHRLSDRRQCANYTAKIVFYSLKFMVCYFYRIKKGDKLCVINAGYLNIGRFYKWAKRARYAYVMYEIYPFQTLNRKSLSNWMHSKFEKYGLKKLNVVFDFGEGAASVFLRRYYKLRLDNIVLINIIPPKPSKQSREFITLPLSFYYHGALFDHRGLLELVEAMSSFNSEQATLCIRGYGPLEHKLREYCSNNKQKNTFVLDPINTEELPLSATDYDIGLTMVSMDVFAHRLVNGFKTYENIVAGVAIVGPNGPNIKPLIERYNIGLVYEDATVEEMTRVIRYCVDHTNDVMDWKRNVRNINSQQYTISHYSQIFLNAIQNF